MTARVGPPVIAVMGPTCSGKTSVALELAQHFPIEIISVDSAQVFVGMDVGTAKPSFEERNAVTHHLVDIIDPTESYSAARFVADATASIHGIRSRGHVPVMVGGTMLYYKALREGLAELPDADPIIRMEIEAEAAERGWPAMHAALAASDPVTAARLAPTDAQRIQRALEIFRLTGVTMSELLARQRAARPALTLAQVALIPSDRAELHRRIASRFVEMLRSGLVDELIGLRARYRLHGSLASMRCVGYRQTWQYLEGELNSEELKDRGIFATRQLAKRQLTWLRATPELFAVDGLAKDAANQVRVWAERVALDS